MVTLYTFDPASPCPDVPCNVPTTFVHNEADYYARSAVRRGRSYQLWANGKMVGSGGPASPFTCAVRLKR